MRRNIARSARATAAGAALLASLTVAHTERIDVDLPMCAAVKKGCFTGKLDLHDIPRDVDGNSKALTFDFGFVDSTGTGWQTNAGDPTDGASIPPELQWIVGKSFDKTFVPAAVIHDRYCDRKRAHRVYPWKVTHRMFYQALLATGVANAKARLMYYAVYTFGPRWTAEEMDVGHVCRGNLTPLCQQLIEGSGGQQSDDPQPAELEKPADLLKKYQLSKGETGKFDVFRRAIYEEPEVQDDLKVAKTVLDATYSTPDSEQSTPDQQMDFIEHLSDTRHPAEAILLSEHAPVPNEPQQPPSAPK